jgi:Mrp family chromosome partitioning ATPase
MIKPESTQLYQDPDDIKKIAPIEFAGVKCMSYGFANNGKTAIMRGPMVTNIVTQLVG